MSTATPGLTTGRIYRRGWPGYINSGQHPLPDSR